MKSVLLAATLVLGSGGLALAQSSAPVTGTAPTVAPADVRAAGEMRAPGGTVAPAPRPNDPNDTGPDKINGLEVPQMKNPQDGGRQ